MKLTKARKVGLIVCAVALVLGLAGLAGASGCGEKDQAETTMTTAWFSGEATSGVAGAASDGSVSFAPAANARDQAQTSAGASLATLEAGAGQKIMKEAVLDLEVGKGKFQDQFDKAQQLASLYGGYVLSSNSSASGEEDIIESGTVAIRVPAASFDKMMVEARKLGDVKYENTQTQDVTEEYTDLKARITNQQAYVNSVLALLGKAKTIEEILQVQQTLTYAQQELEQLKGRMQYLEGHTSFSTLTMNIREIGAEVTTQSEWGFTQALKDAVHNVVRAFSAVVRGLGWLIPIVIILGVVAGIAYLIVRSVRRRKPQRPQDGGDKTA
jgi:hypothetical protein